MTTLTLQRQPSMAWIGTLTRSREFSVFLALALLIAVTVAANPRFLSPQSIKDLLLNSSILVILAVGQAIVIVTKNVDLSVGSVLGLTAFATGKIFIALPDLPVIAMLAIGIAFGALLGALNGALIAVAKVPALVVTLGTLYIFRGVDFAWAQGQQIIPSDLPADFLALGAGTFLGLPYLALIALAVVVCFRPLPEQPALRTRVLRHRIGRPGRPAVRDPRRAEGLLGIRHLRRPRRTRRGHLRSQIRQPGRDGRPGP